MISSYAYTDLLCVPHQIITQASKADISYIYFKQQLQ